MQYRHTHELLSAPMAAILGVVVLAVVGLLIVLLTSDSDLALPTLLAALVPLYALALVSPIGLMMFSAISVEVDAWRLRWCFRLGWPRFSVPLADIDRVTEETPSLWGMGIQWMPWFSKGLHYRAGLRQGVAILKRNGKRFFLDTDEPKLLAFALREALNGSHERREA